MAGISVAQWALNPSLMVDWLKTKMQEFYTLPAKISGLRRRAAQVKALAEQKQDTVAVGQLSEVSRSLDRIQSDHATLQTSAADLFGKLGALGVALPGLTGYDARLGQIPAIPLTLIYQGGKVALGVTSLLTSYARQAAIVAGIETGALTTEERARLAAGAGGLGGWPLYLGLGAVAYLLFGRRLLRGRS